MKTCNDSYYPDTYYRVDHEDDEVSKYPSEVDWLSIKGDEDYHRKHEEEEDE